MSSFVSPEMLTVTSLSILMTMSPGQDFALVVRNALCHSRRSALFTSLGISLAIWVHVAYCIAGIAILIERSPYLFTALKYAGAAYLLYLGIQSIYKSFQKQKTLNLDANNMTDISLRAALRAGFLSNLLNPKATLLFLGIFTQVISKDTPLSTQIIYGAIIAAIHLIWFGGISYGFSSRKITERFMHNTHKVDRVMGFILCGLAVRLVL